MLTLILEGEVSPTADLLSILVLARFFENDKKAACSDAADSYQENPAVAVGYTCK